METILSSVSYPDYNPENKNTYLEKNLLNRVIQSNFEMGSTFKPITATIGYDLNIIEPEMTFDVKNKFKELPNWNLQEKRKAYDPKAKELFAEYSGLPDPKIGPKAEALFEKIKNYHKS